MSRSWFLAPKVDTATSLVSSGIQITNLLLALSGLFGLFAVITIFQRVSTGNEGWARVALWFGMFGALLGGLHGWSDLVRNPILAAAFGQTDSAPAANLLANLPSSVDPRGIGTFAFTGVFFLVLAGLLRSVNGIPGRLASATMLGGVLLEIIFIGTVLYSGGDGIAVARYLFLVAGPIQSVIVGPIVYIWLGMLLRQGIT
jgi:hypothetical protein